MAAGIAYPTLEAIAASAMPGYRYAHDFISDLGRPDSPLSYAMNAAFVGQGTLFLAGAVLVARAAPANGRGVVFVGCAAANAIGNVVVAAVPSGPSGIPWVHVSAAVLAIVGGNVAIVAGSPIVRGAGAQRWYRGTSTALAALGLGSFALLAVTSTTAFTPILPAAVWERASVYTIIGWQVVSAVTVLARRRRGDH